MLSCDKPKSNLVLRLLPPGCLQFSLLVPNISRRGIGGAQLFVQQILQVIRDIRLRNEGSIPVLGTS